MKRRPTGIRGFFHKEGGTGLLHESRELDQFLSSTYSFFEGMKGTDEKNKEIARKEQKNNR